MVSPLAVPFNPDMTEEERIAQQEENNRKAAEFSEEFYSRLKVPVSMLPTGSGFRGVPQPVYQPSTPGFRSTSMFGDIPLITDGPLVTDYTDMSNYTPTYEELPVYDVTTNTYVPDHGGREDDGFDPGSTIIGYEDSAGNPILDSSGKNWNDRDGFTQDDSVDASDSDGSFGGSDNWGGTDDEETDDPMGWSDGGMIPLVYAANGSPAQTATDANIARYEAERKREEDERAGTGFVNDTTSGLATLASLVVPTSKLIDYGSKIFSVVNAKRNYEERGKPYSKAFDPYVDWIKDNFKSPPSNFDTEDGPPTPPKGYYGDDMTDPATNVSTLKASPPTYDPSPGTINPATGEPRRPEDDIIPGGTIPDVNISLTTSGGMSLPKSMVDVYNASQSGNYPTATGLAPISSGPMVDSYTNIDAIQAYKEEFAAAQEAKREAAIQAVQDQIAAAIAASNSNYNDTSPGDDDWDERTGAQAVKDAGGPDRTKGGVDSFYNEGGLVYAHEGTNLLGETKLNVDDNYLVFPQKPSVDPEPLFIKERRERERLERLNARSDVGYEPDPREELGRGESDEGYRRTIFDHPAFVDERGRPLPTDFGPYQPQTPVVDPPGELKEINNSFSDHPAFADESGRPMPTRNSKIYGPGGK